jgi:uncharacterized membrane protein
MPAPDDVVESLEVRAIAVERLTFFADAVVAIAITLLALDLPLPDGTTNGAMLHSVNVHREEYVAFLISFAVVGAHWRAHHGTFRWVTKLGGHLTRLTMLWLLMQIITPFATRVLTGDGGFQVRFIFYAAVQATASLLFILMLGEIRRNGLLREDTPPGMVSGAVVGSGAIALAFLLSIPVSFVSDWGAYACWIAMPILSGAARRVVRARQTRPIMNREAQPPSRG